MTFTEDVIESIYHYHSSTGQRPTYIYCNYNNADKLSTGDFSRGPLKFNHLEYSLHIEAGYMAEDRYFLCYSDDIMLAREYIVRPQPKECECGADHLKHPGHSYWCRKFIG